MGRQSQHKAFQQMQGPSDTEQILGIRGYFQDKMGQGAACNISGTLVDKIEAVNHS
jgi:hypothetical protein